METGEKYSKLKLFKRQSNPVTVGKLNFAITVKELSARGNVQLSLCNIERVIGFQKLKNIVGKSANELINTSV